MNAVAATDLDSVVIFRLGGHALAVRVEAVREVVPVAWLSKPPQMPSIVQGVLDLAGTAVPVLRLDALLGIDDARFGLEASILIMRGDEPLGLLVEHVDGVRRTQDDRVLPVDDARSYNGCLEGLLHGADGLVPLVAWDRLLLEEERHRLTDFQTRTQARLGELAEGVP